MSQYEPGSNGDIDFDGNINGLLLAGICVPEDILGVLLSFLDLDSLIKCRLVCRIWKDVIDKDVWRLKIKSDLYRDLQSRVVKTKLPWVVYFRICKMKPFGRNLLKNDCGQEGLANWTIITSGGDGWRIEEAPLGADTLPPELEFKSCFSTSYHSCSKEQLIDLQAEGCVPTIMDDVQPCIEVSEWYAGRFDCGSIYELRVALLNEREEEVVEFSARKTINQWEGRIWNKVMHKFCNYGPGVRYVRFYHGGIDTQFWAGHYGSKMSGGCVRITLEESPDTDTAIQSSLPNDLCHDIGYTNDDQEYDDKDDDSSTSSHNAEKDSPCLML